MDSERLDFEIERLNRNIERFKRGLKHSNELDKHKDKFQQAIEHFENTHEKAMLRKFDKSDGEQARVLKGTNDKMVRKMSEWAENGWILASIAQEANDDEWIPQSQRNGVKVEGDVVHDHSTEVEDVVMKDSKIGQTVESSTSPQYCPSCRNDISNSEDINFCSECGYEF